MKIMPSGPIERTGRSALRRTPLAGLLVLAAGLAVGGSLPAAEPVPSAVPAVQTAENDGKKPGETPPGDPPGKTEKGLDKASAPKADQKTGIDFGLQARLRYEGYENLDMWSELDDTRSQVRLRVRAWVSAPLPGKLRFTFGMVDECRKVYSNYAHTGADEAIVETCTLERKDLLPGFSAKIGRQDIQRGEGWIFMDGTPLDGSRSFFYNAAIGTFTWGRSTLDLIAVRNPSDEHYFFTVNNKHRPYVDANQDALALYFTTKALPRAQIEAYYVFKRAYHSIFRPTSLHYFPDRSIHNLGARLVADLGKGFGLTTEWTGQLGGQAPDTPIRAWGGYLYGTKAFKCKGKPYLKAGWWGLSGDDPATPGNEGWDPPFSRWPKWGEYLGYAMVSERGVAYYTNLHMLHAEAGFTPWKPLNVKATLYRIFSFHPFSGNPVLIAGGRVRGTYLVVKGEFSIGKNWKGHVLHEIFMPGSFYRHGDNGYFFRAEILYTFGTKLRL